ncbi:hypothetical protein CLHOM_21110 [Clostridium homopropionicum DSM 5847]|uniref:HTH cro/C1-type domain-containing protein n=1 Tax=Clostridium homopropionicum DSM 5847 TaxID=1121318 RepID=A0A0L6Z9N2_9CLOT|nr:helix-turn-helix transcriptional regulator [Clostridium homopropionicum]KOA19503.1 hypothetical protein CLHOM_21110 [Clostridium homopropionicum DSM 5847]SFG80769.1 DNA-binding transcriptional regulator, XRE-family HTH domain [Clostridium homopropionicum]
MNNNIGKSIRSLRNSKNMSQEVLAEKLNVTRQAVSSWENGKTEPDANMLLQISMLFQMDVDSILKNETFVKEQSKISKGLIVILSSVALFIIHFILGICGLINIIAVIFSIGLMTFISLIMYVAFESSIKNKDFSMIAGYRKSDENNLPLLIKQLRTMSFITSFNAVFLNILYVPVYFVNAEKQLFISIIYFAVGIIGLVTTILVVNHKYK